MEPDWTDVKKRLMALTLKEIRPIARGWFMGCLGGASRKDETVREMVSQMRHWWHLPDAIGRGRVRNVLVELERAERDA